MAPLHCCKPVTTEATHDRLGVAAPSDRPAGQGHWWRHSIRLAIGSVIPSVTSHVERSPVSEGTHADGQGCVTKNAPRQFSEYGSDSNLVGNECRGRAETVVLSIQGQHDREVPQL